MKLNKISLNIKEKNLTVVKETLSGLNGREGKRTGLNIKLVNCSTRKIRSQKGGGVSRRHTLKTNINRGGARAFPYVSKTSFKQTKLKNQISISRLLSEISKNENLFFVNNFDLPIISTKEFLKNFKETGLEEALLVDSSENIKLIKSVRNLYKIKFVDYRTLNIKLLLDYSNVIFSEKSWNFIKEKYLLEEKNV